MFTSPVTDSLETVTFPVSDKLETITSPVLETSHVVISPVTDTSPTVTSVVSASSHAVTSPVSDTSKTLTSPIANVSHTLTSFVSKTLQTVTSPVTQTPPRVTSPLIKTSESVTSLETKTSQRVTSPVLYTTLTTTSTTTQPSRSSPTSSTTTTTTTSTTTRPAIPTKELLQCQNGGTYDGIKCICTEFFYGPLCEYVIERFPPVEAVDTFVEVEVKFEQEYSEELNDTNSETFKEFEENFKIKMNSVYQNVTGFKEVIILSIRKGSIIVDHKVIVEVKVMEDVNVTAEYEKIFEEVQTKLEDKLEEEKNCTDPLCMSSVDVKPGPTITLEEFCIATVPEGFTAYYTPLVNAEGLTCVSFCENESPKYVNCNTGRCTIRKNQGPHCLCPETSQYIYTSSNCAGRISKSAVYGGIGTAIVILAIIVITVGVLLFRKDWKKAESDDYDRSILQSEYQTGNRYGLCNVLETSKEEEFYRYTVPKIINFTTTLENIDPSLNVTTKRPEVIHTSGVASYTSHDT
ncbi:hypothetical protein GDO81_008881 [Engystomops pustulosus]|uniref:SEA domain-containing protein n=1 Tax=Engystomops pustulosus TaxID=76066 RepID=A0AAV7BN57_ENGPU|nr:hypothetical protein GDO81_008881 [Engystomops pustulosus]